MSVCIHTIDGRSLLCESPVQGQALLDLLNEKRIVLVTCHPMHDGVRRTAQNCDPATLYDLSLYNEIYRSDRQFFGQIDVENSGLQLDLFADGSSAQLEKESH